jgi:hypothetical protein
MRRYGLRDDQLDRIRVLLPGRPGSVGVTAADNRLSVEAVLYRYRTGLCRATRQAAPSDDMRNRSPAIFGVSVAASPHGGDGCKCAAFG